MNSLFSIEEKGQAARKHLSFNFRPPDGAMKFALKVER
jgi:hypothetical protein